MSPRASEPVASGLHPALRGSMRQWARLGQRALRKIASRQTSWTVFVEADGVVGSNAVQGARPMRHDSFQSWALAHPESRVLLVVSATLLHTLRLDEVATRASIDRLRLVAAQRFAHYYGAPAASWPIAIGRGTGFACALHGLPLASIVRAASANRIDLAGMVPLWSDAIAGAVERAPVLGISGAARLLLVEHRLVTCLSLAGGELIDVQQRLLDAATPGALDELVDRLGAESTATPGAVVVTGWGIEGVVADPSRFVLGPFADGPEDSAWLFATNPRVQA